MYQWTGNVGLVNVSDLLRASTNIACISATDEYNAYLEDIPRETYGSYLTMFDVLDTSFIGYWTINSLSSESNPRPDMVWIGGFRQDIGELNGEEAYIGRYMGARPVVYLKSFTEITGGDGTKSNPYIIQ